MRSVLVVREFDDFSRILAEHNFAVINCPTIEIVPLEDLSEFEARLDSIKIYDGVFLTSANAAEIFRRKLLAKNINFHGVIYVLGKRSFDLLKNETLDLFFDAAANTAREMLEKISPDKLKEKRFLFVRGEKSLRVVPDFLEKIAAIDEAIVYRTNKISVANDKIKAIGEKSARGEIVCACFFSPSGAEYFTEQFGSRVLRQMKIAAIGKTTADFLETKSLTVDFTAAKATAENFANGLIEYLKNDYAR